MAPSTHPLPAGLRFRVEGRGVGFQDMASPGCSRQSLVTRHLRPPYQRISDADGASVWGLGFKV
jgi:hypothetical protein